MQVQASFALNKRNSAINQNYSHEQRRVGFRWGAKNFCPCSICPSLVVNVTQCIFRRSKGVTSKFILYCRPLPYLGLLKYSLIYEQICNEPCVLQAINMSFKIFVQSMHTKLEILFSRYGEYVWYLWCPLSLGSKCFVRPISK